LAAAINKSVNNVVLVLESAIQKSLTAMLLEPLEGSLDDLRDQCARIATEAKQVTSQIMLARRIHIGGYALAAAVITLTLTLTVWFNLARRCSDREEELIQQIDQNRQVLSELARRGAVLELQRDPADSRKLYLLMKRAKTWTTDRHVIVEVK